MKKQTILAAIFVVALLLFVGIDTIIAFTHQIMAPGFYLVTVSLINLVWLKSAALLMIPGLGILLIVIGIMILMWAYRQDRMQVINPRPRHADLTWRKHQKSTLPAVPRRALEWSEPDQTIWAPSRELSFIRRLTVSAPKTHPALVQH